jgi:drug/metabolite transporter (DMT)-like permease
MLTLGHVLTIMLAIMWLGERPSLMEYLGILLILIGVTVVLAGRLRGEGGRSRLPGVVFGLLAVICMSVSIIIAKEALAETSAIQATFVRMLSGMVGILLYGLATRQLTGDLAPLTNPRLAAFFILSVCVVTFGGFWLSLVAIQYTDVSIASTLNSTEPLFILPLAAFFLKEKIGIQAVIGSIATVAGIALLASSS